MQRITPNRVLGRVSAIFFNTEAITTLIGSVLGPAIAQATVLTMVADIATALALVAAGLAYLLLPRLPIEAGAPDRVESPAQRH